MDYENGITTRTRHNAQGGPVHYLTDDRIRQFRSDLLEHEKSDATIEKYIRDVTTFQGWLRNQHPDTGDRLPVDKSAVKEYKSYLRKHYKLTSTNSMLSALNTFLKMMDWHECRVATFKIQALSYRNTERDLSLREYRRLVDAANSREGRAKEGGHQIGMIMETLAGTGIRISELRFITVESLSTRRANVSLKGKTRVVLIPVTLCRKLRAYCRERKITSGTIFITRNGRPVDRSNVLHRMKTLSRAAGVRREKLFPHNLRHLFAVSFYQKEKDIARLADILGHSNINTTRIYTLVTLDTQLRILDRLGKTLAPE